MQMITNEISQKIQNFALPDYHTIPDIGLFLDQTAKYLNSYLDSIKDASLTGSMISNYVKKKIIPNPIKKLYYRDQIATLFFIAIAKTVLSLEDIQLLLELGKEKYTIEESYQYFTKEFEDVLKELFGVHETEISEKEQTPATNRYDTSDITKNDVSEASEIKLLLKNTVITAANKAYLAECFQTIKNN